MELFVDRRLRRFSLIMLFIACVMFIVFGFFVYLEGQNVQLLNFEEIGKHYTKFAEDVLLELQEATSLKMQVITNHEDTGDFVSNPFDVNARYQVQVVIGNIMRDVRGFKFARVVPKGKADRTLLVGRSGSLIQGELIIPEAQLRENESYVSPIVSRDNAVEMIMTAGIFKDDILVGTVYVHIDITEVFRSFSERIVFRETGLVVFLDTEGRLLYESDRWHFTNRAIMDLKQLNEERFHEGVHQLVIDQHEHYIYGRATYLSDVDEDHLHILFIEKSSELFSFTMRIVRSIQVIILICIFLYGLILYISRRYYSRMLSKETLNAFEESLGTEVEKQTRVLRKIADSDALTGLHNHGALYRMLEEEIEACKLRGKPLVLLMLDVDYFKDINDTYGHQIGDEVLKEIAKVLVDSIRDVDIAGRYGGEEFVLLLKDTHLDLGYTVAERIRRTMMAKTFTQHEIQLTISIGIAEWQDEDVTSLIKRADTKLYDSKSYGRNKTTF